MKQAKVQYGNWVSKTFIRILAIAFCSGAILTALSFSGWGLFLPPTLLWVIRLLLSLFTLLALSMGMVMLVARHKFSYDGGRVSAKILQEVVSHIKWDGRGSALDIGCGSGALSVLVAKTFPEATVVGVDYWGFGWDYAKEQCEQNARLEGVADRIRFQHGDAAHLDFADGSFDLAVSNFVFHEVRSQPKKRLVVVEALRVVKKGAPFVFHDLFYNKKLYGDPDNFLEELRALGLQEVRIKRTSTLPFISGILRLPILLKDIGMIYGIR